MPFSEWTMNYFFVAEFKFWNHVHVLCNNSRFFCTLAGSTCLSTYWKKYFSYMALTSIKNWQNSSLIEAEDSKAEQNHTVNKILLCGDDGMVQWLWMLLALLKAWSSARSTWVRKLTPSCSSSSWGCDARCCLFSYPQTHDTHTQPYTYVTCACIKMDLLGSNATLFLIRYCFWVYIYFEQGINEK